MIYPQRQNTSIFHQSELDEWPKLKEVKGLELMAKNRFRS
jgi:hypothetical protein